MEIRQWLQPLLDSMTCSGIAATYTCINRFTRHNFYVAMGPAGFLASFNAFLIVFFYPPHKHICSPSTQVNLPGKEGGLVKEEGRGKKGAAADPGFVRGEHVPKVPTPLHPWTCGLRTGRGKASPVGRTLLGGHAQCALPPDAFQERKKRRHRE